MSANDGKHLLETWLEVSKRSLTASQMLEVLDAFNECPYPLFLKVCIITEKVLFCSLSIGNVHMHLFLSESQDPQYPLLCSPSEKNVLSAPIDCV